MRFVVLLSFLVYASQAMTQQATIPAPDSLAPAVYHWNELKPVEEETGLKRELFKGSTTTLLSLEVAAYTMQPGQSIPFKYKHDDLEELMIIKEGSCRVMINGTTKILGPGSIAFVLPGDEHSIENAGQTIATYYILKYKGKIPDHERGKKAGASFMLDWNELKTTNTGKGYRRNFFDRATSQLAQFEMHTTALNADSSSHAPHTHQQEEIVLILRGNVTMHIDGKLLPASPGDVVFLPARIPHALLNTGREQCEYFAFQWRN